jgi:hypothetical protein
MRDDASAALELALQLRAHGEVHLGREKERDHCGVANVCYEEIFIEKPDAIDDVCLTRILPAFGNAQGIDIDTDAACAELPRRGDDDASVAARTKRVSFVRRGDSMVVTRRLTSTSRSTRSSLNPVLLGRAGRASPT